MKNYDIAAFIWPSYTGDEPRTRIFWPDGIGEWQTVKAMTDKGYKGCRWPRIPTWGYINEADSSVMEMQIDCAVSHGVNVFIYDWYWYDNRPFLENCLNDGFLKAKNNNNIIITKLIAITILLRNLIYKFIFINLNNFFMYKI